MHLLPRKCSVAVRYYNSWNERWGHESRQARLSWLERGITVSWSPHSLVLFELQGSTEGQWGAGTPDYQGSQWFAELDTHPGKSPDPPAAHGTAGCQVSRGAVAKPGVCPRGHSVFWFIKSNPCVRFSVILFANLLSLSRLHVPQRPFTPANEFNKALTGDFIWPNCDNNFTWL